MKSLKTFWQTTSASGFPNDNGKSRVVIHTSSKRFVKYDRRIYILLADPPSFAQEIKVNEILNFESYVSHDIVLADLWEFTPFSSAYGLTLRTPFRPTLFP